MVQIVVIELFFKLLLMFNSLLGNHVTKEKFFCYQGWAVEGHILKF